MHEQSSFPKILIFTLIFCLFPVLSALAHKINVFAYTEGNQLIVESYFSDGKPVENAKVSINAADGAKLQEGTTGDKGKASFPIPAKTDLTIEVDASMGHKASFTLKKEEL